MTMSDPVPSPRVAMVATTLRMLSDDELRAVARDIPRCHYDCDDEDLADGLREWANYMRDK